MTPERLAECSAHYRIDSESVEFYALLDDIAAFDERCRDENGESSRMYLEPDEWEMFLHGLPRYDHRYHPTDIGGIHWPPPWVRIGMVEVMPR